MKNQIRAPKARKVNSYMVKSSNIIATASLQMTISEFVPVLEKRNSENNLHCRNAPTENDCFCIESIESEFDEQVNKLSVLREINGIFSQQEYPLVSSPIDRCENPFSKNWTEAVCTDEYEMIKVGVMKTEVKEKEEEQAVNTGTTHTEEAEQRNERNNEANEAAEAEAPEKKQDEGLSQLLEAISSVDFCIDENSVSGLFKTPQLDSTKASVDLGEPTQSSLENRGDPGPSPTPEPVNPRKEEVPNPLRKDMKPPSLLSKPPPSKPRNLSQKQIRKP
eukprot:CAMPEP_0170518908 /NCGR_PEP_ID=MMETSP0209-20121228/4501_1 /TAXON_ID=665100 ORGANISM="Litonotus pictus, Strain P1" /NCGR_SAMPLE_ID=MMETSP0209 /ASSEMBLY_ACC=CAM_ASM_000301 /LENGTH=277 /DNA_ID=CAMNT_0010804659 /DNA_START=28 /DNA_END=862 /DNA_ORIENTATION=+